MTLENKIDLILEALVVLLEQDDSYRWTVAKRIRDIIDADDNEDDNID